jgi:hypothetical protein
MRATYFTYLILLDFLTLKFDEEYKLWSTSQDTILQSPVNSPKLLLNILLPLHSVSVRPLYEKSNFAPSQKTGKIMLLYIFKFLLWDCKKFWNER